MPNTTHVTIVRIHDSLSTTRSVVDRHASSEHDRRVTVLGEDRSRNEVGRWPPFNFSSPSSHHFLFPCGNQRNACRNGVARTIVALCRLCQFSNMSSLPLLRPFPVFSSPRFQYLATSRLNIISNPTTSSTVCWIVCTRFVKLRERLSFQKKENREKRKMSLFRINLYSKGVSLL